MTSFLGIDPGFRHLAFVETRGGNIINHYIHDLCPKGYNKNKHNVSYLLNELVTFLNSQKAPTWLIPGKIFAKVGIESQMKSKLKCIAACLYGLYGLNNKVCIVHPRTYKPKMCNGHFNNKMDARDYLKLKQPYFICSNTRKTDDVADAFMLTEYMENNSIKE